MNIVAFFTSSGVPATGLSPTIRVRNISTGALTVTDQAMAEVGDGFYKYDYATYDPTIDYAIRCDGTVTLPAAERYVYGGNELAEEINEVYTTTQTLTAGNTTIESDISSLTTLTEGISADIVALPELTTDAVWDEPLADHTTPGTYGHELATKADIVASTSTIFTPATSGSVIQGTETSGTWQSTVNRDNIYWNITEDTLTGITVELIFNIPELDRPGILSLFGRYEGQPAGTHYIELWAWNYEVTAWEQLVDVFIPGGSLADAEQVHEYYERNVDRTSNNEVKFRLVHHITNYVGSHNMYIDTVYITSIAVITAEDIANAVWSKTLSGGYTAEYVLLDNNESLKRALGLMHENIYIDNASYDGDNNLVGARVRIYSDAASVGTANNVIGTYTIGSTGSGAGKFTDWAQVKV